MVQLPWRRRVHEAQEAGDRIAASFVEKEREIKDTSFRVLVASSRAEAAAIAMLERQDLLNEAVAKRPTT